MSTSIFEDWQQELDACFHRRDDPYPAGSAEHAELLQFVARLQLMKCVMQGQSEGKANPCTFRVLGHPSSWGSQPVWQWGGGGRSSAAGHPLRV
ncbi:hypothetical protein V8C86DRAFT_2702869 [Haematococcus lacustris]